MSNGIEVAVAPWRDDAPFVYSITYDEGTIDAITNSYPIHQEYDIPGHICAVSGYLGTRRLERGTSMREVFHMTAEQLRFLIDRGWTVSSHSHTHCPTNLPSVDLDLEVRISKWELEKATGHPVHLLTYWNNLALADQILPVAKAAGYLGILSIGYPFNAPDYDVWDIGRGTLGRDLAGWLDERLVSMYHHTRAAFPGQLTRENTRGRWLVDITHIVADRLPRACGTGLWNRCSTPAILAARLREVRALWGDDVWAAVPEEVVAYTLLRRATTITCEGQGPDRAVCTVQVGALPEAVVSRALTFRATLPWRHGRVNGGAIPARLRDGRLIWTADVEDGSEFVLEAL